MTGRCESRRLKESKSLNVQTASRWLFPAALAKLLCRSTRSPNSPGVAPGIGAKMRGLPRCTRDWDLCPVEESVSRPRLREDSNRPQTVGEIRIAGEIVSGACSVGSFDPGHV